LAGYFPATRKEATSLAEKENQHTVSKFLLRQFTPDVGEKVLWQFSKTDCGRPLRKSPEKAASESYFYSVQRDDGTWDHSIEDALGDAENNAAPALRRLIEADHAVRDDRLTISNFIGLRYLRSKAMRDHAVEQAQKIKDPEATIQYIERDFDHYAQRYGAAAVRAFMAKVKERGEGVTMPKNVHLVGLFERGEKWGAEINKMSWTVWKAKPPNLFVISDNPAFCRRADDLFTPGIVGLRRRDLNAELGFPLSSRAFLIAKPARGQAFKSGGRTRGDCKTEICDTARARNLNVRTVLSAHEHVFSPDNNSEIGNMVLAHRDFHLKHPGIL
jgi:hypothetical protein